MTGNRLLFFGVALVAFGIVLQIISLALRWCS